MHHLTDLSFLFMFFLSLRMFKFSFRKFQSYSTVLPTTVIMLYIILSLFILYLDVCTLLPTSASFPRPQNLIITFVFSVFVSLTFYLEYTYKSQGAVLVFLCLAFSLSIMLSESIHVVALFTYTQDMGAILIIYEFEKQKFDRYCPYYESSKNPVNFTLHYFNLFSFSRALLE